MSDLSSREPSVPVTSRDLDMERGIRLAAPVAIVCGIGLIIVFLALWVIGLVLDSHIRLLLPPLLIGWIICEGLLWGGYYQAKQRQGGWAARMIVMGILCSITIFQVSWATEHGYDAIFFVTFMAQIIPIGLSSVLDGSRLMFIISGVTTAFAVVLLIILPAIIKSALSLMEGIGSSLIVSGLTWATAVLVYGSSQLYIQTLDEVGALRLAYERARQLDDLKTQFITHVNHELRTPIMMLQGAVEFLHANYHQIPVEQVELTLAQAERSASRLVKLLSSILDVRQIERRADALVPKAIVLAHVAEAARDLVDPQRQRTMHFHISSETVVWADEQATTQILLNLLSNAMKYSAPEMPITIRANLTTSMADRLHATTAPLLVIAVEDRGLGIPPEHIPLLFNRFVRLPRDLASMVPGSGIGLYLCRTLAEAMGGSLMVESEGIEGKGSTFFLQLPLPPSSVLPQTLPHPRVKQASTGS